MVYGILKLQTTKEEAGGGGANAGAGDIAQQESPPHGSRKASV